MAPLARGSNARRRFLIAAMEDAGYTMGTLAARLKLDTTYISRVVNGHRTPSLEVAAALAAVLNIPIGELVEVLVPAA